MSTRPEDDTADVFARPRRRRRRSWDVLAVIAAGGGLGSVARYALASAWPAGPDGFPWATFVTNVTGCLALGVLMVYVLDVWPPRRYLRPFLGVGVLGGFTTFSTYAVETRDLAVGAHGALAGSYAAGSLLAGLFATWCGITLARFATGLPVRRAARRPAAADGPLPVSAPEGKPR